MSGFAPHRVVMFILGAALATGLLAQNALAARNAYLQIPGIAGQSTDSKHPGWIEIQSFQWGVGRGTTMGSATGRAGAGRSSVGEIQITKTVDSASPKLFQAAATGKHFQTAVIEQAGSGGRSMTITLQDVFVSSVQNAGAGGGDIPTESITLQFARSSTQYANSSMGTMQRMETAPMMRSQVAPLPH